MSAPVDTQHQGAPSDVCVEMEVLREAICKLCSITCPCTYITLCILVQPIAPQLKLAPGGNSLPEPACSHQHHMLTSPAFTPVSLLSPSTILQPFKGPFGQHPALTWVPQGPRLPTAASAGQLPERFLFPMDSSSRSNVKGVFSAFF